MTLGKGMITKIGVVALSSAVMIGAATASFAHQTTGQPFPHVHSDEKRTIRGQQFIPTIWIDPDGCEHWVMDDGWEGYMTPKLDRNGIPTCKGSKRGSACGVLASDTLFATNSYTLNASARQRVIEFFRSNPARGYRITGHTDSRASDGYNMTLSQNRANSVARIARSAGANVVSVLGEGERRPVASNNTTSGMAQNRRVEITCVN